MSNDQSVFSFELNESLYFERGQEVGEIMGISLEPEISIQPFNEYISIRGVVELQGSYLKAENENEVSDEPYFTESYHSKRYMERVVDIENGSAEFVHRFPVEISVPTYRVDDLDDVTVMITSFDYELPDPNQLQLKSTIEIHGINDQAEESREVESPVNELSNEVEHRVEEVVARDEEKSEEREAEDTFEFEIKKPKEESSSEVELADQPNTPTLSTNVEDTESDSSEDGRWKYKQTQTFSEFFNKNKQESSESSPEYAEATDDSPDDISSDYLDLEESPSPFESSELSRESNEGESREKADLSYLSDMFRNDEESYSQMRLCIVQESDTLDSIAERYETTSIQIVNQNHLDDDHIKEGQLLYIPYRKQEK
ncbi:stage VI sporulation protein D [Oceanobacillus limi]|uniref:Stage VI sporulation protein D n=1 Tax=Oceanobacillus limi TaxID=930131 RepID=A0A1I0GG72_9BACI|nr:stage VI sporulation protein D [Oceanobacillus limi]SET69877.1 stage VI sporulation protein D [Oceanobacillus limi]